MDSTQQELMIKEGNEIITNILNLLDEKHQTAHVAVVLSALDSVREGIVKMLSDENKK